MSNIQQIAKKNDKAGHAPLRRFLVARLQIKVQNDVNTESTVSAHIDGGGGETIPGRFNNCPKRSPRRTLRIGAGYITESSLAAKSWSNIRSRKSKSYFPSSKRNENHKIPRVAGHCRCGKKLYYHTYGDRCENCFAEDAERWSGKNQAVVIM